MRKRGASEFAGNASASIGRWDDYRIATDIGAPLNAEGTLRSRFVGSWQDRDFHWGTKNQRQVGYAALDWDLSEHTTLGIMLASQKDRTGRAYGGLPAWSDGELIRAPRDTNLSPPWARQKWNTLDYRIDLEHRFGKGWQAKAQLQQKDQNVFYHYAFTTTGVDVTDNTVSYGRRGNDIDYSRTGIDLFVSGPVQWFGRTHQLLLGYNYARFENESVAVSRTALADQIRVPFGRGDLVPDFSLPYESGSVEQAAQRGFYGQARISVVDPLTVVLGARSSDFERRSRALPPSEITAWRTSARETGEVTPYGGFTWDINHNYTVYGSYSDIFVPLWNMRADGSTLDPRVGKQHEVGAKAEFLDGRLLASLALFRMRDSGRPLADTDNPGYFVSAGEAESKGWEIETVGNLAPGYDLQAGYTRLETNYISATPIATGKPLSTWEPRHTFKLWLARRPIDANQPGFTYGAGFTMVSGSSAGYGEDEKRSQGGYTIANAAVGYRFDNRFSLSLNGNNLFDKTYYTRLGGINTYNSYGAPRSFTLTGRYTF